MKSTLDVLKDARALYSENPSHASCGVEVADGTRCVVYALWDASHYDHAAMFPAEEILWDAAGITNPNARMKLIDWNARSSTETVLAAFDQAISACEQQQSGRVPVEA